MITLADLEKSTFLEGAHYNMGRKGYAYRYDCVEYPRFRFINRTYRNKRRTVREWYVDGSRVADLDAVVAALNVPPVLTDDEALGIDANRHYTDLLTRNAEITGHELRVIL